MAIAIAIAIAVRPLCGVRLARLTRPARLIYPLGHAESLEPA
jgi:hypothetical protein